MDIGKLPIKQLLLVLNQKEDSIFLKRKIHAYLKDEDSKLT